jgi:mannose-6-phosphate isomerase-like protein (cupin superfamily)
MQKIDNTPWVFKKPWGWEAQVFNSSTVGISFLSMMKGKSTSLHCHPNKRTGYIVLKGEVQVEFLAGKRSYARGDRVNFRKALFHRTEALTEDVIILELESPSNKNDLIRLEDHSGREDSIYESELVTLDQLNRERLDNILAVLSKNSSKFNQMKHLQFEAKTQKTSPNWIINNCENDVVISPLSGSILTNKSSYHRSEGVIVFPGDVTCVRDLKRMSKIIDLDVELNIFFLKF